MKNRRHTFVVLLLLTVALTLAILWRIGLIGIWSDGMARIADNTKDFSDHNGYAIQGEYAITIDLADLESNIGKEIYNDGEHKIYVAWVQNSENVHSGGYNIGFRSSGQYSLSGATLVSGARHARVDDRSFTTTMSATMRTEYNGKSYPGSVAGTSGINYKDGDDFSFYLFPSTAYESGEVVWKEAGEATITLSNLYKNVWSKK